MDLDPYIVAARVPAAKVFTRKQRLHWPVTANKSAVSSRAVGGQWGASGLGGTTISIVR